MNRAGHQRTLARRGEPLRHTERDLVQGTPLSPNVTRSLHRLKPAVARLERGRIRITDRHGRSGSGNAAHLDTGNGVDVRLLRTRDERRFDRLRDQRLRDSLTVEVDPANPHRVPPSRHVSQAPDDYSFEPPNRKQTL